MLMKYLHLCWLFGVVGLSLSLRLRVRTHHKSVDFHDEGNRWRPGPMIIRHVKHPMSVFLACVLSAKLNPSASSPCRSSGASPWGGNRASILAAIGIACMVPRQKMILTTGECTRFKKPNASSAAIQAKVAPSLEAPVSSRTIRMCPDEGHLGLRPPLHVLPLMPTHQLLRLDWCHVRGKDRGNRMFKASGLEGLVTSSIPLPLKILHIGDLCTLNLSKAQTSSRWCGVVVRRGGASSCVIHVTETWFKITWSVAK
ncbi:uncharacterized protein TNCV_3655241 [Trichonephila clavipes]|nr:uncharacterized protein TNCV_3655241 [Trichonephila clavipes]